MHLFPINCILCIFTHVLIKMLKNSFLYNIGIFQNFQGCFTVQLSMYCYRLVFLFMLPLSSTSIYYYTTFATPCQYLFFTFFNIFLNLSLSKEISNSVATEKEGFEPSRRANGLHPQQGRLFSLLSISPVFGIITAEQKLF